MQQVKDFINFFDIIVGTFWSFSMIELLPIIISGQVANTLFSSISGVVQLLFAFAGLLYLVLRMWHFYRMSILHWAYRREELIEKRNLNSKKK
jgi:hypothetical protein